MKRLIPLLLVLCLLLCACGNETPVETEPSENTVADITEEVIPETTEKHVEVPEGLKCVCYVGEQPTPPVCLSDAKAAALYTEVMKVIPDRNKSNPSYVQEGQLVSLVFYTGETFDGQWTGAHMYHGVFYIADNGVVAHTGSPFTSTMLKYQLTPELYTRVAQLCEIEN